MIPMRQRVLLVAGWVVAAAVTSLVASGAVAMAGGQVNDRPLTRVLAADVAALPVVETEGDPSCEPLASGGFDCSGTPSGGAQATRPGSSDELDPVGGENDLSQLQPGYPDGVVRAIDSGNPEEAGPGFVESTTSSVVHIRGGSISFAVSNDQVLVVWVIPQYGYAVEVTSPDDATVRVIFAGDREQSIAVARLQDNELTVETFKSAN